MDQSLTTTFWELPFSFLFWYLVLGSFPFHLCIIRFCFDCFLQRWKASLHRLFDFFFFFKGPKIPFFVSLQDIRSLKLGIRTLSAAGEEGDYFHGLTKLCVLNVPYRCTHLPGSRFPFWVNLAVSVGPWMQDAKPPLTVWTFSSEGGWCWHCQHHHRPEQTRTQCFSDEPLNISVEFERNQRKIPTGIY